ncbi:MAG: AMIN domain-containing protein, partial [Rhodospirillaceae bacterium]|nr:AMIN domain-containing protein [Rhodospirillaceae bacterium]
MITVLCVLVFSWPAAVLAMPEVIGARIGAHPKSTRLVLELSEPIAYQVFTLEKPYRVVIDFPEIRWRALSNPMKSSTGLV